MEPPSPPKLLDRVRQAIRLKHYSYRTEQTYVAWIKRCILFHNKQHPKDMGVEEVRKFLSCFWQILAAEKSCRLTNILVVVLDRLYS